MESLTWVCLQQILGTSAGWPPFWKKVRVLWVLKGGPALISITLGTEPRILKSLPVLRNELLPSPMGSPGGHSPGPLLDSLWLPYHFLSAWPRLGIQERPFLRSRGHNLWSQGRSGGSYFRMKDRYSGYLFNKPSETKDINLDFTCTKSISAFYILTQNYWIWQKVSECNLKRAKYKIFKFSFLHLSFWLLKDKNWMVLEGCSSRPTQHRD